MNSNKENRSILGRIAHLTEECKTKNDPDNIILNELVKLNEYVSIVGRIGHRIAKYKTRDNLDHITVNDLVELVKEGPEPISCYPGVPNNRCCPAAFFISLTSDRYILPESGHIDLRKALELFKQHMQGPCKGKTNVAVLICDSWWDQDTVNEWKSLIEETRRDGALVDVFLDPCNIEKLACN